MHIGCSWSTFSACDVERPLEQRETCASIPHLQFALFEALKAHMQHARAQATAVPVEAGVVVETTSPAATPGNGAGRRRQTATKVVVALEDAVEPLRL